MTGTAIGFFIFGAIVLWGGFAATLGIAIKNEKNKFIYYKYSCGNTNGKLHNKYRKSQGVSSNWNTITRCILCFR